jgi:integrase
MGELDLGNVKIKRKYFHYLQHVEGLSDNTIKGIEIAINLFEEFSDYASFLSFRPERAAEFKNWLSQRKYREKNISIYTIKTYIKYLKKFFLWLSQQPGYISKIKPNLIEYFNLRRKENRIVSIYNRVKYPEPDYCIKLANSISIGNEVDMRDRALVSFAFLTGMRDHAIVSLPLDCVDEEKLLVYQNPSKGVETKFTKYIVSKIFPIDLELVKFVIDWIKYLKKRGFSPTDPVFPRAKDNQTESIISFQKAVDVEPIFWKSTDSFRKILKTRSLEADLPYFVPRAIRHTTAYIAMKHAKSGAELKAVSQHFGHEEIKTTLTIYGNYDHEGLIEALNSIDFTQNKLSPMEEMKKDLEEIKKQLKKKNRKK